MFHTPCSIGQGLCGFDKTLTPASFVAILLVFSGAAIYFYFFRKTTHLWKRLLIMCVTVLCIEVFTAPMWNNMHLGSFGYVYGDISWIVTLRWGLLFSSLLFFVRSMLRKEGNVQHAACVALLATPLIVAIEIMATDAGIRSYAPEIYASSISFLPWTRIPVEILYYAPVFSFLSTTAYLFWEAFVDEIPIIPFRNADLLRRGLIGFGVILCMELVIDPLTRQYYPAWTNIYHDVSIIPIFVWMGGLYFANLIVHEFIPGYPTQVRFIIVILLSCVAMVPYETFVYTSGFKIYEQSVVANFSGFKSHFLRIPIEVFFAIPLYLSLVYAPIRYLQSQLYTPQFPLHTSKKQLKSK
jgi:uncharacterized membrane protein YoaK (UPF0700 family)